MRNQIITPKYLSSPNLHVYSNSKPAQTSHHHQQAAQMMKLGSYLSRESYTQSSLTKRKNSSAKTAGREHSSPRRKRAFDCTSIHKTPAHTAPITPFPFPLPNHTTPPA